MVSTSTVLTQTMILLIRSMVTTLTTTTLITTTIILVNPLEPCCMNMMTLTETTLNNNYNNKQIQGFMRMAVNKVTDLIRVIIVVGVGAMTAGISGIVWM